MRQAYRILADLVLAVHVLFVAFVILGLIAVIIGSFMKWQWVRNLWFRLAHLLGIEIVVAQAWAGIICPLTTLEMWLRRLGGDPGYQGSFIQYWLQRLLYYDAPEWVFIAAYSTFGLLVVLTWLFCPPRFSSRKQKTLKTHSIKD